MRRLPLSYNADAGAALVAELVDIPDAELVRELVNHGQDRASALAAVANRGLRVYAVRFYYDVADARKGDVAAKERVDYCRHMWNERRKVERAGRRSTSIVVPRSL